MKAANKINTEERSKKVRFEQQDCDFVCALAVNGNKNQKISHIMDYFDYWITFMSEEKLTGTVVFDIDDTLIDYNGNTIKRVVESLKHCLRNKFDVCIVTARHEKHREETIAELEAHGIKPNMYKCLEMHPNDLSHDFDTVSQTKAAARRKINLKHPIIANVGDMFTDLVVHPLKKSVKIISKLDLTSCGIIFFPEETIVSIKLPAHVH